MAAAAAAAAAALAEQQQQQQSPKHLLPPTRGSGSSNSGFAFCTSMICTHCNAVKPVAVVAAGRQTPVVAVAS